jgi:hypothetical protein
MRPRSLIVETRTVPVKTIKSKTKAAVGIAHTDAITMKTEMTGARVNEIIAMIGLTAVTVETIDQIVVTAGMIG